MIEIIKTWFSKAVPNPTVKNKAVQLGVHFEEVAEMVASMGGGPLQDELQQGAYILKTISPDDVNFDLIDRKELLDALCDQIVTAIGVAHMFNLDIVNGLAEVNRSNWSKFIDGEPVFDENGKIKKGEKYSPPDLTKFV